MSILLFNEVKLNRNLDGYNFPSRIKSEDAFEIVEKIYDVVKYLGYEKIRTSSMESIEKLKIFEKEDLNAEIFKHENNSAILVNSALPTILLNGTDHIEINNISSDKSLVELYEESSKIEDIIDKNLKYAFREDFGYLTSNPINCGTAMRPSVCLHLPATIYFGVDSLISSLNRLGYKASALRTEKGIDLGSIYRISPVRTIGKTEAEYIKDLKNIIDEIIDIERQNREKLYLDRVIELEDMVNRACGILTNVRIIDEEEMIEQFSKIILGIELNIIKPKKDLELLQTINSFKNSHIQIEKGTLLDGRTRNILRANNIRKMMKEVF